VRRNYNTFPSLSHTEMTKKNFHRFIHSLINVQTIPVELKKIVIENILRKVKKSLDKIEKSIKDGKTDKKSYNKIVEYSCFMIKTLEDCFRKSESREDELIQYI
jgi:hypothetical protein